MVAGMEERDDVMVALTLMIEVGRTGAPGGLEEEEVVEGEAGQLALPQRRPDRQQPPPKLEGQDWKPEEQVRGFGVVVVMEGEAITIEEEEVSEGGDVVVGAAPVGGEAVTVGLTTTIAVELRTPRSLY